MARKSDKPFTIKQRNGSQYWHVRFAQTGVRCSSGCADYEDAERWAWGQIYGPEKRKRPPVSMKEFTKDFFVPETCPIVKRLRSKGKQFRDSTACDRRSNLEIHIWAKREARQVFRQKHRKRPQIHLEVLGDFEVAQNRSWNTQ